MDPTDIQLIKQWLGTEWVIESLPPNLLTVLKQKATEWAKGNELYKATRVKQIDDQVAMLFAEKDSLSS